jgi:hypothetical protein
MATEALSDPEDILLDRPHIALLSLEELGPGARVSLSRIEKMAALGAGPPIDFVLGNKYLTKRRNARMWLRSLLREPQAA